MPPTRRRHVADTSPTRRRYVADASPTLRPDTLLTRSTPFALAQTSTSVEVRAVVHLQTPLQVMKARDCAVFLEFKVSHTTSLTRH